MASRRNRERNPNLGRSHETAAPPPKAPAARPASMPAAIPLPPGTSATDQSRTYWLATGIIVSLTCWLLFDTTIVNLIRSWSDEQDYSHGFLVVPFAVLLLWLRRESFPKESRIPGWGGLVLIALSFGVRHVGERFYLTPLAGWALVLWLAGACWLAGGLGVFRWASPGLFFLLFMIPLPFRLEQALSWHLQSVTTAIGCAMLQCLGQPAIAEAHRIFLGDHVLEVEQACSGLRMMIGIAAVAFAFAAIHRSPWWKKAVLALAVGPVAMLSNAVRVVATGLLMQTVSGEAAARFSHDAAGWAMIIVAVLLFGSLVVWLDRIIIVVETESARELLKRPVSA